MFAYIFYGGPTCAFQNLFLVCWFKYQVLWHHMKVCHGARQVNL